MVLITVLTLLVAVPVLSIAMAVMINKIGDILYKMEKDNG